MLASASAAWNVYFFINLDLISLAKPHKLKPCSQALLEGLGEQKDIGQSAGGPVAGGRLWCSHVVAAAFGSFTATAVGDLKTAAAR